jgi:methyltransferase family protein
MWNYSDITTPTPYWGDESYIRAISFLDGPGDLEDWGCGTCYAKKFVKQAKYCGIDSSQSRFNDVTCQDLTHRTFRPNYILLRHVLEHNYHWKGILQNALRLFKERMVLIIFTPFNTHGTEQIAFHKDIGVPDLSFKKSDITDLLPAFTEEKIGAETIFYITHE